MKTYCCNSSHHACINGHIECLQRFIAGGLDINIKNNYGETPLHFATMLIRMII
jgi:ankyrin repeat protein